ncbi:MAG: hypothetical protein ACI9G1_003853, partial [Pirellulaceae bacterium]
MSPRTLRFLRRNRRTQRRQKLVRQNVQLGVEKLEARVLLATLNINASDDLTGNFADLTISRVAADYHFTDATDPILLTGSALLDCSYIGVSHVTCPVADVDSMDVTAETIDVTGDIQLSGDLTLTASNSGTSGSSDVHATLDVNGVLLEADNVTLTAKASLNAHESGSNFERIAKISGVLEFAVETHATVVVANTTINAIGNVTLIAGADVQALVEAEADVNANTDRDASKAITLIDSLATADVLGTSAINLGGALSVTSNNSVNVVTDSDGTANGAGIGGVSLALSHVDTTTRAAIQDGATVAGATTVDVVASSTNNTTTDSTATSKGAVEGTPGDTRSETELNANGVESSDGQITHAAAISIANIVESTQAFVSASGPLISLGDLTVNAFKNHDLTTIANGSSVDSSEANVGVGVAVALSRVNGENQAFLARDANINVGGQVFVEANQPTLDNKSDVIVEAISGAGGNVAIAGSVAINIYTNTSEAFIDGTANVDVNGADVILLSQSNADLKTKAVPDGNEDETSPGSVGGDVGIGASFALTISNTSTVAKLRDGANLINAGSVGLRADGTYVVLTVANGGAEGGLAITPVAATSILNNETEASVGSGADLVIAGDLNIDAAHNETDETKAQGDVNGVNAAVGASLALSILNSSALATVSRNIDSGSSVKIRSRRSGKTGADSLASATGAEGDDGTSGSPDDAAVNDQVDAQRGHADTVAASETVDDSGATNSPSAEDSDGTMSVAAAISINIVNASSLASIGDGINVTAIGPLSIRASQNTDSGTNADGSSTNGTIGVGAAAALAVINIENQATISDGAAVSASEVSLLADMQNLSGDKVHTTKTQAKSGASADDVGIAGSLAITVLKTDTLAHIANAASVDTTGNVILAAESETDSSTKAIPDEDGGTGESLGVGASIALNIIDNNTLAEVSDGAIIASATDLNLNVDSDQTTTTHAIGGAEGGVAITPVVAISLVNNNATARIGTGAATTIAGD